MSIPADKMETGNRQGPATPADLGDMGKNPLSQEDPENNGMRVLVVGVGGAGTSIVLRTAEGSLLGVENIKFAVMDTNYRTSKIFHEKNFVKRLIIGKNLLHGHGCGMNPELGEEAVLESKEEIVKIVQGADCIIILNGDSGGTGTGAAPKIAEIAAQIEPEAFVLRISLNPFFEGQRKKFIVTECRNKELKFFDDGDPSKKDALYNGVAVINNEGFIGAGKGVQEVREAVDDAMDNLFRAIYIALGIIGFPDIDVQDMKATVTKTGRARIAYAKGGGDDRSDRIISELVSEKIFAGFEGYKPSACIVCILVRESISDKLKMDELTSIIGGLEAYMTKASPSQIIQSVIDVPDGIGDVLLKDAEIGVLALFGNYISNEEENRVLAEQANAAAQKNLIGNTGGNNIPPPATVPDPPIANQPPTPPDPSGENADEENKRLFNALSAGGLGQG